MDNDRLSKIAKRFDKRATKYDSESLWVLERKVIRAITSDLSDAATALEVAGGTGVISSELRKKGLAVTCTDLSLGMLKKARERGLPIVRCDMHWLPFPDRSFDLLFLRQGLQYATIELAFAEFRRVAKREVRVAQIVAASARHVPTWKMIFSELGQPDRHVFAPGEIARAGQSSGLVRLSTTRLLSRERLLGPNSTRRMGNKRAADIARLIRQIDPVARLVNSDFEHRVAWEIVRFTVPK